MKIETGKMKNLMGAVTSVRYVASFGAGKTDIENRAIGMKVFLCCKKKKVHSQILLWRNKFPVGCTETFCNANTE